MGTPTIKWQYNTGCDSVAQPTYYGGRVYISGRDTINEVMHVTAVDAARGTPQWDTAIRTTAGSSPVVICPFQSEVYAFTIGGFSPGATLYAFNATTTSPTAEEEWRWRHGYSIMHVSASAGKVMTFGKYASSHDGRRISVVHILDATGGVTDGENRGTVKFRRHEWISRPAFHEGVLYYAKGDGVLCAWEVVPRKREKWCVDSWSGVTAFSDDPPTVHPESRGVLFVSTVETSPDPESFYFILLDMDTGAVRWTHSSRTSLPIKHPLVVLDDMGLVYVSFVHHVHGARMSVYNTTSRSNIWTNRTLVDAFWSPPTYHNRTLYAISSTPTSQHLSAFDFFTGDHKWTLPLHQGEGCDPINGRPCPGPPTVTAGLVYVPGSDGTVYAVSTTSPSPSLWKKEHNIPTFFGYVAALCGAVAVCIALLLPRYVLSRSRKSTEAGHASRYHVVEKLGSGGFGVVYLVSRKTDGEKFAMKYIQCDNDDDCQEALSEWRVISALQGHPNMIKVHETFMNWSVEKSVLDSKSSRKSDRLLGSMADIEGSRYVCIVMPYYPEGDLKRYILSYKPGDLVPERVILSFAGQVCSLLSVLHCRDPPVIHRDLKPENILIDCNRTQVVVTDFGLAKDVHETYCRTRAGTFAFMAPEMWDRHYSTEVDIWALGCIMYAMATKRVEKHTTRCLWREAESGTFHDDLTAELLQRGYSVYLPDIINRLLTFDRHLRPSAREVHQQLDSYIPLDSTIYGSTTPDVTLQENTGAGFMS